MCGIGFGIPMTTMSAFMKPLIVSLQATATEVTLYFTIVTLASIPAVIVGPRFLKRNAPLTIAVCGIAVAVALVALAMAPSVPMVWVAAVVVGLFYPTASTLSAPILIANWFKKASGTFMGLAMAFTGVGSAILVPVVAGIIQNVGWQTALAGLGVAYAICIVVAGLFLVRYQPAQGVLAYGELPSEADGEEPGAPVSKSLPGVCYKDIFKMPAFYVLAVCLFIAGFASIINQQINTIAQFSGFDVATAAFVVSCMSLGNVVGKLMLGAIKDKTSGAVSGLVGGVCMIVGIGCFLAGISNGSSVIMYVGGAVCGLGSCLGTMACPLYAMDTFGPKEYGTILGTVSIFITAGNAIASPVVSSFYDTTGSYNGALVLLIVCTAVLIPLGFAAVKMGRSKWARSEADSPAKETISE